LINLEEPKTLDDENVKELLVVGENSDTVRSEAFWWIVRLALVTREEENLNTQTYSTTFLL